jgi:hypothetical protein
MSTYLSAQEIHSGTTPIKSYNFSLAPMSSRLMNILTGGESHFYVEEAAAVEALLNKHFYHVCRVETCGLVRFSAWGKIRHERYNLFRTSFDGTTTILPDSLMGNVDYKWYWIFSGTLAECEAKRNSIIS